MENQIYNILNDMAEFLNVMQMKKLQKVLIYHLNEAKQVQEEISNEKYLEMFLTAKQIEGCSDRTIQYYRVTIEHMLKRITIPLRQIATEDIRQYLIDYQKINNCGKVTIDNIRRNLSSFFSWLEEEDHILKSPVKRIHKIKTKTVVKEVISDESIEILRDNCKEKRDLAIIDLLFSTGMRVGELVNLDIADIDFNERECIVYGNPISNSYGLPEATLPELGEFGRGVSKHRPRNDPRLLDGEYPLIQTGDIANTDLYITLYNSTYSELGLQQSKMWNKGTLCITIAANIAKTAILRFDACFPDSVVGFNANERTNNIFIHYWFSFFQSILESQAPESAQKNINLKILSELKVIVPKKEKQDEFVEFINQLDKSK